jgi:ABC-type dipeptide/oligopeptide/nickel transport system permease component
MRVKHSDNFLVYKSPVKDGSNIRLLYVGYWLPYIDLNENRWNSKIVEGITVILWSIPVFGIWFPFLFIFQSIWMVPLHVYKGIYNVLGWLDKHLY